MSLVGFKAKNHRQQVAKNGADDGVDERITPPEIFDPLHAKHGFTLDVAANADNRRVPAFYDLKGDGLSGSWAGQRVWCNPPYSACGAWVCKALDEVWVKKRCPLVVMLLPANRCEQSWWNELIEPIRDRGLGVTTQFLRGRPRFGWPTGRVVPKKGDRPPFGLVVVTFECVPVGSKPEISEQG